MLMNDLSSFFAVFGIAALITAYAFGFAIFWVTRNGEDVFEVVEALFWPLILFVVMLWFLFRRRSRSRM